MGWVGGEERKRRRGGGGREKNVRRERKAKSLFSWQALPLQHTLGGVYTATTRAVYTVPVLVMVPTVATRKKVRVEECISKRRRRRKKNILKMHVRESEKRKEGCEIETNKSMVG